MQSWKIIQPFLGEEEDVIQSKTNEDEHNIFITDINTKFSYNQKATTILKIQKREN